MERWVVAAKRADFAAIGKEFGIDPVIARLIRNRDVQDRDEIRRYLYGKVDELASPHLMKDVDKAVEILRNKIKEKKRIRIIGDSIDLHSDQRTEACRSSGRYIYSGPCGRRIWNP